MTNNRLISFLFLGLLTVCTSLQAAEMPAPAQGGPVLTRLVHLFSGLEGQLNGAVATGDQEAIDRLLTDDFEMRVGVQPGEPVPRAQWLAEMRMKSQASMPVEQIAVHDHGNIAVVSFLQKQRIGRNVAGVFVIDVWVSRNGRWMLSTRYADVPNNKNIPLGVPPPQPKIEKRY